MKINIYTFGNTKHSEIKALIDNYYSLISRNRLLKLENIQIADKNSSARIDLYKFLEEKSFSGKTYILSEFGKEYSTTQFLGILDKAITNSSVLNFVVGNAYGWSPELEKFEYNEELKIYLKKKNVELISLSQMTYSHDIAKLLLVEQLYRYSDHMLGGKYSK
jgi:23S rRNA (pseudouridine1915-N3)-methyltransferase